MAYKTMREVLDSNVELNRGSLERFGLRLDVENQFNFMFQIQQAVDKVFEMSLDDQEGPPYYAVCLASFENPTGKISNKVDLKRPITQVIARVPKIHGSIPKPYAVGSGGLAFQQYVRMAIGMHPTFYAEISNNTPLPKPGNIIKVDISSGDSKYGEYLGIIDSSSIVDTCGELFASKSVENPEALRAVLGDVGGSNDSE